MSKNVQFKRNYGDIPEGSNFDLKLNYLGNNSFDVIITM
jgi:hypothetical protein